MAIFIGLRPESAFTRVPNDWARDPKLTTKAKGLLLYLLSHQDGYQLSLKQVIAENADGRDAIYKTLAELAERGYLRRDQRRRTGGTVGEVDYYVADAPVSTASGFTASGESGSGHDQGKQDVSAGGTASWNTGSGSAVSGKPATKKTRVKKTKVQEDEKTISLSAPEGATDPGASVPAPRTERETVEASPEPEPRNPVHRLLLEAGCPEDDLDEVEEELRRRHEVRAMGPWVRKVAANEELAGLVGEVLEALNPPQSKPSRAAFIETLRGDTPCDHGIEGGNIAWAHDGWMHCMPCRQLAGWTEGQNQGRTENKGRKRSTAVLRAEQGLAVADELDRKYGHGAYAPGQIRSPADQRVADAQPLYDYYKGLEEAS